MLATLFQKTTPISYVYTALLMVGAIVYRYMRAWALLWPCQNWGGTFWMERWH